MVEMFIKHVLGVNQDHPGLYGKTAAYYATVEQQGRLTLHLHMLLWILNSLSPQEIRDQIMDPNSDFQKRIVEYLESVHIWCQSLKHHYLCAKIPQPSNDNCFLIPLVETFLLVMQRY